MNRKKRFLAKVIDGFVVTFVIFIITRLSMGNSYEYFLVTYPFLVFSILFIYFGVVGNNYNGSLGKKLMNLAVINKNNHEVPSTFKLFIREPIVQFILAFFTICIIGLTLYNIFPSARVFEAIASISGFVVVIFILLSVIFAVCYLIHRDWWNNNYRIISKEDYEKHHK